jgi:hypothetical protein
MNNTLHYIGKDCAIALFDSEWWKGKTAREIVNFQLFTAELCIPFNLFHQAVEESLGRPVWTHEFGLNYDGIVKEFLGEIPPPTFDDIIAQIPADKLKLVVSI